MNEIQCTLIAVPVRQVSNHQLNAVTCISAVLYSRSGLQHHLQHHAVIAIRLRVLLTSTCQLCVDERKELSVPSSVRPVGRSVDPQRHTAVIYDWSGHVQTSQACRNAVFPKGHNNPPTPCSSARDAAWSSDACVSAYILHTTMLLCLVQRNASSLIYIPRVPDLLQDCSSNSSPRNL